MKVRLIIATVLIFCSGYLVAQQTKSTLLDDNNTLNTHLAKYMQKKAGWHKFKCFHSNTFFWFIINAKGNIDSLNFSLGTPKIIKKYVRAVCRSTNGSWKESNFVQGAIYMLPLIIAIERSCKNGEKQLLDNLFMLIPDTYPEANKPRFPGTLVVEPMECIVLNPFYFSIIKTKK